MNGFDTCHVQSPRLVQGQFRLQIGSIAKIFCRWDPADNPMDSRRHIADCLLPA